MKPDTWKQLKSITSNELISALKDDGWVCRASSGSVMVFKKQEKKVSIHYHPHKTYGPKQLKELLIDIGWTEQDLKRLKLVK